MSTGELRRLAEAATPGEWTHIPSTSYRVGGRTRQVGPMVTGALDIMHGGGTMQFRGATTTEDADAAYIAAASPDILLRLLDRIDILERALGVFAEWPTPPVTDARAYDAARAALSETP